MSLTSSTTATTSVNPWNRILGALEKKINRHSYDTWLKPTRFSHVNANVLFIRVPTPEFRHIADRYADLISEAIDNLALEFSDVQFITPEEDPLAPPPVNVRHDGAFAPTSVHSPSAPARSSSSSAPSSGATPSQSRFDWDTASQLNQKYTFGHFVIGSGNQFAHAAAQAVAAK